MAVAPAPNEDALLPRTSFQCFPPNPPDIKAKFDAAGCGYEAKQDALTSAFRGRRLFGQWWSPGPNAGGTAAGNGTGVIFLHGIHEHSTRYTHVCEQLAAAGCHVGAIDHVGHGHSEGVRGLFGPFANLVADVKAFIDLSRARWGDKVVRLALWGQSYGAQIAIQTCLAHAAAVHLLVITSGACDVERTLDLKIMAPMAGCVASICPGLRIVAVVTPGKMSQSAEEVERYAKDPLNKQGKLTANAGHEALRMWDNLRERRGEIRCPLLVMHSPQDNVCLFSAARTFYEGVSSADKAFEEFDLFHTMLHEDRKQEVIDKMLAWIVERSTEEQKT